MDGNTSTSFIDLPLRALRVWAGNPRKIVGPVDELAASIRSVGLVEPLVVRALPEPEEHGHETGGAEGYVVDGHYTHEVIAGQRRYLAAAPAGLAVVPCRVVAIGDAAALELALVENSQRVDCDPLDEAESIGRLVRDHGRSPEEVASRLGRPVAWVRRRLSLLALVPEARKWLASGKLPLGHALALAAVDAETQGRVCERWRAPDELPSRARWSGEVTMYLRTLSSAPFDVEDAALPGGACWGCPKNTAAQGDLFGEADASARCLDSACWQGKVDATWQAAQKAAKKRRLTVIAETVGVGWRGECTVEGRPLTTAGAEDARPVAVARDRWGRVVELFERPAPSAPAEEDDAEPAAPAADRAAAAQARRDAATKAQRAALAALLGALATPAGMATGLRAALLTVARDLEMSCDLRAVVEADGQSTLAQTDAELVDAQPDTARALVATILATWAADPDAEDEAPCERELRATMTRPAVPTVRVWVAEAAWDALGPEAREDFEEPIGGATIAWQGTEGYVFADVPADEVLTALRGIAQAADVALHEGAAACRQRAAEIDAVAAAREVPRA